MKSNDNTATVSSSESETVSSSRVGETARWNDRVRRLWSLQYRYVRRRDWLYSIYNRMLVRFTRLPLPFRHRIREIRLEKISDPFFVRLGTTDWYVLEEVFIDGVYDPLVERSGQRVRNVIDLGANTGFSVRLWQLHFPDALIIAVEPDDENIEMCRMNLLSTKAAGRTMLVRACVSGAPRQVSLDRRGGSWRFSMREAAQSDSELIEAQTLPQIAAAHAVEERIDILKCNIEGAEAEVFADCGEWIGRVGLMAVQVHSPYTTARFLEDLKRAGAHFNLYQEMDCDAGSRMLFLEQSR